VTPARRARGAGDYMAPWIDTTSAPPATSASSINPAMFAYNDEQEGRDHQGPDAGPTGPGQGRGEVHGAGHPPGSAADRSGKDIDKWIARGEKYN
jgi:pyruvate-ferredoxin/flavodoxin oxidoreductase